jgi:hypothetical protein
MFGAAAVTGCSSHSSDGGNLADAYGAIVDASMFKMEDARVAHHDDGGTRDGKARDASSETPHAPDSAGTCRPVVPSSYDTSCAVDTDCVEVGQVASCPASACDGCNESAVNQSAVASYKSALAKVLASVPSGQGCGCPCDPGFAVCRAGKCQAAGCGPTPSDTLAACADAGGTCSYAANTTCMHQGPADACAYSDEVCCN